MASRFIDWYTGVTRPEPSTSTCCDHQADNARAKNKTCNGKNRHIRLRHNFVRQLTGDVVITLDFAKSEITYWILSLKD